MTLKTREIYSPSFDAQRRKNNKIKFLIFHYTGMKNEKEAIKRLSKIQSGVGTNYFIKRSGEIVIMVPDSYTAWHAGISRWEKYKFLNKHSIGVEISNPGHRFGYLSFPKKQINSLIKLSRILIKKYKIKKKYILGHSDVAPDRKMDPGEKFPWKILYKNEIGIWHNLKNVKLSSIRKKTTSIKEVNLFMKNLSKFGYPRKSIIVKNKRKYKKLLVKAFQRRFRAELIDGKIDQECLLILNDLLSKKA
jgi:N-acetylmuramoyl-L-alanine amidase